MTAEEAAYVMMSGGSSQNATFHYILGNQKDVISCDIDDVYTVSVGFVYYGGHDDLVGTGIYSTGFTNVQDGLVGIFSLQNKTICRAITISENDMPIYSTLYQMWGNQDNVSNVWYPEYGSDSRQYWYKAEILEPLMNTFAFDDHTLTYNVDNSANIWITYPSSSVDMNRKTYTVDTSDPSIPPVVVLDVDETVTSTFTGTNVRLNNPTAPIYSDLLSPQLLDKQTSFVNAVYEASGLTVYDPYLHP